MSLDLLITTFVTLFVIVDPIALAPIFITLTSGMPSDQRRGVALRSVTIAFFVLATFGVMGASLLEVIGIGIPAFRISGGILLFLIAVDMLFEGRSERREKRSEEALPDPSVFPIAMPLLAGPGALATMIILTTQHEGHFATQIAIHGVMVLVLALAYLLFRLGGLIERVLGHTGIVVVSRLLGIVLAAMSVQFVLDGLADLGLVGG